MTGWLAVVAIPEMLRRLAVATGLGLFLASSRRDSRNAEADACGWALANRGLLAVVAIPEMLRRQSDRV